ncbi:MAG TPA: methyl-accepting chemotaxis protein [Syntrophales bacterium]|nr:methyl-accepting chemotaxis protein [Syntrophales bacterium]
MGRGSCRSDTASRRGNLLRAIRNFILIIGAAFLAVTVLAVFFFARSITRPIHLAVSQLNEASGQVSSASGQVAQASQSLAEGASESASSLEETSSSLEEMTSMTRQNADHATQAKSLMAETKQIVEKVDAHMNQMAQAMADVTKTSEDTGKIIKTIDEIAFQTNLLALNAAVEAARVGEAGAGFAVVADEVRNLAIRAAEAAKNTSVLIENTLKSVKNGNELTKITHEAFKGNVEISVKVGNIIDEIAAASQEQAQGIQQINIAVSEMDKVTQATAANAEESASAAEEMNAQAGQMKEVVRGLVEVVGGAFNGNGAGCVSKVMGGHAGAVKKSIVAAMKAAKKPKVDRNLIPMKEGEFQDF